MKTDLDIVLESLENSVRELEIELEDSVQHGEFQAAHYLSNALNEERRKLEIFNHLKNPYKDQIQMLKSRIKSKKKWIEQDKKSWIAFPPGEVPITDHQKMIEDLQSKLEILENSTTSYFSDSTILMQYIQELINGNLHILELILKEEKLQITKSEEAILIQLSPVSNLNFKWHSLQLAKIKLDLESKRIAVPITGRAVQDALQILSIIVYELYPSVKTAKLMAQKII
ncbi:hypothetical protein [Portibacter marinus]|uniref:hypothetical protein n=1 Tax=Portibacter marinus TaxID=2898660 RepID=UPI001F16A768|nr:hypothetical protein [Portibacter marinus]